MPLPFLLNGIMESQKSGHLYTPKGSYDSIAAITVPSGGLSSITFQGIPAGYRHLQLRWFSRTLDSSTTGQLTFNGDSGSNYNSHYIYGVGSGTPGAGSTGATTYIAGFDQPNSSSTAGMFGGGVVDILDYASTTKLKTVRLLGGNDQNGSGVVALGSGLWFKAGTGSNISDPITSITFKSQGGSGFAQNSFFSLYGVK